MVTVIMIERKERDMNEFDFETYVLQFYGKGGIYDYGFLRQDVRQALKIRMEKFPEIDFDGDSFDRELVRDIVLKSRGVEDLEYNV